MKYIRTQNNEDNAEEIDLKTYLNDKNLEKPFENLNSNPKINVSVFILIVLLFCIIFCLFLFFQQKNNENVINLIESKNYTMEIKNEINMIKNELKEEINQKIKIVTDKIKYIQKENAKDSKDVKNKINTIKNELKEEINQTMKIVNDEIKYIQKGNAEDLKDIKNEINMIKNELKGEINQTIRVVDDEIKYIQKEKAKDSKDIKNEINIIKNELKEEIKQKIKIVNDEIKYRLKEEVKDSKDIKNETFMSLIEEERPLNKYVYKKYLFSNRETSFKRAKIFLDNSLKGILTKKIPSEPIKDPLVTVIIPVYNCKDYITRAIKSIQNQNMMNIEIILVNDNSTDNTSFIIEEMQKEDQRIKIINNQKNMGTLYSRCIGALSAKGKYIFPLDNDDMFLDEDVLQTIIYNKMELILKKIL